MRALHPRSLISTYAGFRFLATFISLLIFAIFGWFALAKRFTSSGVETVDYMGSLVIAFWSNEIPLLIGICFCWVALYVLNAIEPFYYLFTKRTVVRRRDYDNLKRLRLLGRYFGIALLIGIVFFIPVFSPRGIGWLGYVFATLGSMGTIVGVLSSLGFRIRGGFEDYTRLIDFDFARCSFDVAKIAPRSEQVERVLHRNPETVDVKQLLLDMKQLLGVQDGSIRLHTNTTAAYDHALHEMRHNGFGVDKPLILASDAEYPKIDELLTKHANGESRMTLVKAEIWRLLWNGESDARITDAYVQAVKGHGGPVHLIALCHVHHATGREIPVNQIIDRLEAEQMWSPSAGYVLIDGAQSVGNIPLSRKLWERADFYAFCGHKWLLGTPTLGLLFTKPNPRLLQDWKEWLLHAGLSQDPNAAEEYDSTASIESRVSLEASLGRIKAIGLDKIGEWNLALANLFREILPLAEAGIYTVPTSDGGIVAVRGAAHKIRTIANYLSYFYGSLTTFTAPIVPAEDEGAIRFCFHCYHSRDDVFRLVERIRECPLV